MLLFVPLARAGAMQWFFFLGGGTKSRFSGSRARLQGMFGIRARHFCLFSKT